MDKNKILDITEDAMQCLDELSFNHCVNVGNTALLVEKALGLNDTTLSSAAFVHDIGKQYIAPMVLYKKGRLTPLEREIVDYHAFYGYKLLSDRGVDMEICYIVLYHHGIDVKTTHDVKPCLDKKVIAYSRMLHTIDIYCALTENRPFRGALTPKEAISVMEEEPSTLHLPTFEVLKELAKKN